MMEINYLECGTICTSRIFLIFLVGASYPSNSLTFCLISRFCKNYEFFVSPRSIVENQYCTE